MKRTIWILALIAGNCTQLDAMEDWYFRLSHRACSWFHKKDKNADPFPLIVAFDDFAPLQDKEGKRYAKSDLQEFNGSYKSSTDLDVRCSKLALVQSYWLPIFGKDRALLNFARTMAKHEKEWALWHTDAESKKVSQIQQNTVYHDKLKLLQAQLEKKESQKSEIEKTTDLLKKEEWKSWWHEDKTIPKPVTGMKILYYETNIGYKKANIDDIDSEPVKIIQDYKSPYYKFWSLTHDMHTTLSKDEICALNTMNARENTAYHDELKFLQTQLHKAELYWNMQPLWQRIFLQRQYNRMHGSLEKEVASFKAENNRSAFTRSCMKKRDFRAIQSMRKEYIKSQQTEL
jgi:hypothetical protein